MPKNPAALLQAIQYPRPISHLLLQLFVIALIGCALLAVSAYLCLSGAHIVSEYRRQLNASANKAQMFLNQRETLLRTIAASAVRIAPDTPPSFRTELNRRAPRAVRVVLPGARGAPSWEVQLTERLLGGVERAGARLIYNIPDVHRGFVLRKSPDGLRYWVPLISRQADHIEQVAGFPENASHPVVWLGRSDGGAQGMSVHAPVDRTDARQGWLGLEFMDLEAALSAPGGLSVSYALFDSHGRLVLGNPGARDQGLTAKDYFGFERQGWLPSAVVLSQSLGAGGLRVMYSIPIAQLLADGMSAVQRGVLAVFLFLLLIVLGACGVRSQWLIPARRQHAQLVDSLALNRELIAAAPVGLALLLREGGLVLRANPQARDWMARDPAWRHRLAGPGLPTCRGDVQLNNERVVHVRSESLRYRGLDVVFCTITDVTAQKEVEASLIRTRQLAEEASQAKTRFLATMSHEIRTPLYGLMGALELLDVAGVSAQQRHYLDALQVSADALSRTVNDALDLSRIEAGHLDLLEQPLDLLTLVDSVVAAFAQRAESKGLHLYAVTDISNALSGRFLGDARRISQVLGNLVSNAIKFTDAGRVVLRVEVQNTDTAIALVRFQVCDTGIGVDPAVLPRLFDPYFRTDVVQARQMPGTGLGLTICRQLAQRMNGSLQVASQPGLGTRILFELPLPLLQDEAPDRPRLEKRPIHVDGRLPEVVAELCRWLCRWGGLAVPYQESGMRMSPGSVLIQAWPASGRTLPDWDGPIVRACPAGAGFAERAAGRIQLAPAYSVLDIARAVELAQRGPPPRRLLEKMEPAPSLGLRVLVVDDHCINQEVLAEQLGILGCEAVLEDDGRRALKTMGLERFDVVITDLNMPALSGYALAESLLEAGYDGRILGMTADTSAEASRRWRAMGLDSLLVKPISIAVLRERLQAASSRSAEAC